MATVAQQGPEGATPRDVADTARRALERAPDMPPIAVRFGLDLALNAAVRFTAA